MSAHVAVIGAGNWGTALANLLANKGCVVTVSYRRMGSISIRCDPLSRAG